MSKMTKNNKKTNSLRLQRRKHVDCDILSKSLGGKRINAHKRKFGVELISYDGGGFSLEEKIIIAETINGRFNGKEVI